MRLRPPSLHAAALPLLALAVAAAGCTPRRPTLMTPGATGPMTAFLVPHVELEDVLEEEQILAGDSMQGRMTGTPGMHRAARYLAERFRHWGLEPAGDDGYLQHMPLAWAEPGGRGRLRLLDAWSDTTAVPAGQRATGVNVVAVMRG
ncbi:MAG TPA: hypothetical protein VM890_16610, partial [Longimicrobium sp.]|nr:hypothetical protein [Longimicrobium sp.]